MKPVSGGTLTARVLVPEIDGGMTPLLIATQNLHKSGYYLHEPEMERVDNFISHVHKYLDLRTKPTRINASPSVTSRHRAKMHYWPVEWK